MILTTFAVYEDGVLRPEKPLSGLTEKERVYVTISTARASDLIEETRVRIQIDHRIAQEIIERADYSILES